MGHALPKDTFHEMGLSPSEIDVLLPVVSYETNTQMYQRPPTPPPPTPQTGDASRNNRMIGHCPHPQSLVLSLRPCLSKCTSLSAVPGAESRVPGVAVRVELSRGREARKNQTPRCHSTSQRVPTERKLIFTLGALSVEERVPYQLISMLAPRLAGNDSGEMRSFDSSWAVAKYTSCYPVCSLPKSEIICAAC